MVDNKPHTLSLNPWHPSLRTKRIQGTSEFEVGVNMDICMAIAFEGDELIIMLEMELVGRAGDH